MSEPSLESRTAAAFDAARTDHEALVALVRRMPKGSDLHSHISGAIPTERLIEWGAADGACFDPMTGYASLPPCTATAIPISMAAKDAMLRDAMLKAWSMEGFSGTLLEGHQHFFDAFEKFGAIETADRLDDMIAEVLSIAGANHQTHVELLQGFGSTTIGSLAETKLMPDDAWDETYLLAKRGELLADPSFVTAVEDAKTTIANALTGARTLLACGTPAAAPGCDVEVRMLVSANRTKSREFVFGQWVFGFELAQVVPEVVGVNLVSPEEHPNSLLHYDDEMAAAGVLHLLDDQDPSRKPVHVSLHAGELIPEVLPMTEAGQAELTYHIRSAVDLARAERIGHGVDVLGETMGDGPTDLLADMAERGVMVELGLSSNDALLAIAGKAHPYGAYLKSEVPVAPATDDQGILRIDITREYVRVVEEHGADYLTLKRLARTSLEHSFLSGASLWKVRDDFTAKVDACANDTPGTAPSSACSAFLEANDKARVQWRHETDVAAFEQTTASSSATAAGSRAPR